MGAPFLFLNLASSGRIGFHKKKNRQAKRILLCFRLPVDWVCVPETMLSCGDYNNFFISETTVPALSSVR